MEINTHPGYKAVYSQVFIWCGGWVNGQYYTTEYVVTVW